MLIPIMNCIIIEDQPPAQRILKKYINDVGSLKLKGIFNDAVQALDFIKSESVDLIFLDIHLPKMSGLDFLKTIPDLPPVILTSAYSEYALESYDFDVVDYLLKPFSFQRFVKAVSRVPSQGLEITGQTQMVNDQPVRDEIFIKIGYEHIRISINDILYIKSDADYSEIHLSMKKYLSSDPLKKWMNLLKDYDFERVHKSFIVNVSKITKVTGSQVYLDNKSVIPIGRSYKDDFNKKYLS